MFSFSFIPHTSNYIKILYYVIFLHKLYFPTAIMSSFSKMRSIRTATKSYHPSTFYFLSVLFYKISNNVHELECIMIINQISKMLEEPRYLEEDFSFEENLSDPYVSNHSFQIRAKELAIYFVKLIIFLYTRHLSQCWKRTIRSRRL